MEFANGERNYAFAGTANEMLGLLKPHAKSAKFAKF